jgi:hypothetical protein
MYKQYVWSFDDEYFNSDMFDTKEECLNDAKKYVAENGDEGDYFEVYIAEVKEWNVTCDSLCVDDILDRVAEDAWKNCGESAEDWEAYNWCNQNEINELADCIANDIRLWQKKYGYEPTFYKVDNITEYELGDKE